jgi:hypothetical protein
VYAFDDSAFWMARLAHAAGVPCLVLRAVLLASVEAGPDPVLQTVSHVRLRDLTRRRRLLGAPALVRAAGLCRRQLAATVSILLVLHSQPAEVRVT